jgi:hypothetical protein
MDPSLRGLSSAERARRSLKLLQTAVDALDRCLAGQSGHDDEVSLSNTAERRLKSRIDREPSEANVTLAEQLWDARSRVCGDTAGNEEPLNRLMAQLTR